MASAQGAFARHAAMVLALGLSLGCLAASLYFQADRDNVPGLDDPARLVRFELRSSVAQYAVPYPLYEEIRGAVKSVEGLAASVEDSANVGFDTQAPARRLSVELVTENYFSVLGLRPVLGLTWAERAGVSESSCLISHRLWQRLKSANFEPLGETLSINGAPFTVLGVLPPGFLGPSWLADTDLWLPIAGGLPPRGDRWRSSLSDPRDQLLFTIVGRLGVAPLSAVQTEIERVWSGRDPRAWGLDPSDAPRWLVYSGIGAPPEVQFELNLFFRALGLGLSLLLLVCSLNASTLLLTHSFDRSRTWALMQALGARPTQVLFHIAAETATVLVMACLAAGVLSFAFGFWLTEVRVSDLAPGFEAARFDWRVLASLVAGAVALGFTSSFLPARIALSTPPSLALKDAPDPRSFKVRFRRLVTLVQISCSFVLITISLLLRVNLDRLEGADLGINPKAIATASFEPAAPGYSVAETSNLVSKLTAAVQANPEIARFAFATTYPFKGTVYSTLLRPDDGGGAEPTQAARSAVSAGFFETLGCRIVGGRDFAPHETLSAAPAPEVAIVSRNLAERLWPGSSPLGRRFRDENLKRTMEVVGVVENHKTTAISEDALIYYAPLGLDPVPGSFSLLVKTTGSIDRLGAWLDQTLGTIDRRMALYNFGSLEARIAERMQRIRTLARAAGTLALAAAAVAGLGLWGLLAGTIRRRRRELGIRLALGATARRLQLRYAASAAAISLASIPPGILGLMVLEPWIAPALEGGSLWPTPWLIASALLVVSGTVVFSLVPLRRVGAVNPADCLRAL